MKTPNLYLRGAGTPTSKPRAAGRPRADGGAGETLEKKSVLLSPRQIVFFERLGGGNLSLGIRKAADTLRGGLSGSPHQGRIEASEFETDFNQE